ncbi:amphi-Trp domain-containing protein [Desulfolithobacter sp.]
MGREKVLFKSEEKKSVTEVCAMLRQMADKIEQGHMTLSQGGNEIVLDFPRSMVLEIKVEDETKKRKGTKRSLEIELEWYPDARDEDTSVTIG